MKFGEHLLNSQEADFAGYYIDYEGLKELINQAFHAQGASLVDDDRTTSMTVSGPSAFQQAELRFYDMYESQVRMVSECTDKMVSDVSTKIARLREKTDERDRDDPDEKSSLMVEAESLGDRFLKIEKYVNINYLGLHKILKKHDKNLPQSACRQFYLTMLHKEKWFSGDYSTILVMLSKIFSDLRGDASGIRNDDAAQGFVRSTTKYWVRAKDVSFVKYTVLQNLPVFQFDATMFAGDAQLVNSVYLDNAFAELYHGRLDKRPGALAIRLRWYGTGEPKKVFVERKTHLESWKGETSVKERFMLDERKVIPFLEGVYGVEEAMQDLEEAGKSEAEIQAFAKLFTEVQRVVESKQLRPTVRTQYMRTAFQIPYDATVRISLDTNLTMIKEMEEGHESVGLDHGWYRKEEAPITRTDLTRFPHAVLEVKLSLPEGTEAPEWVMKLLRSDYVSEVHKFSKFIHGTCTLFPDVVQAVPYWVDDESVRKSMVMSAPAPPSILNAEASYKPREFREYRELPSTHPVLGAAPNLRLLRGRRDEYSISRPLTQGTVEAPVVGNLPAVPGPPRPNIFDRLVGAHRPRTRGPMKLEPKSFFANERTFLNWLHMAVTIGSIAAGLLGFAATAERDERYSGDEVASVEIIAMIMLPLAVMLCVYALGLYLWRNHQISHARDEHIDDKRGPVILSCMVVLGLVAILLLSLKDMTNTMMAQDQDFKFLLRAITPGVLRSQLH